MKSGLFLHIHIFLKKHLPTFFCQIKRGEKEKDQLKVFESFSGSTKARGFL